MWYWPHALNPQRRPVSVLHCGKVSGAETYFNASFLRGYLGCSPKFQSALSYTASTAAACSTFNDIHFQVVTVHQDSSLQSSRTSTIIQQTKHKQGHPLCFHLIFLKSRDKRRMKGQTADPITSSYQMRKESVSKDYFFLDNWQLCPSPTTYTRLLFQETSWWTLLTVFLLRKFWWFGYFYCMKSKLNKMEWSNIFSVSTSDNDVNVMCHSEFISRVLSTPIPDPIMHFISEWDCDCVIEFRYFLHWPWHKQVTRLLSTSTTIRLHSTGVPLHFTHFSFTHPLTIMIVMIDICHYSTDFTSSL